MRWLVLILSISAAVTARADVSPDLVYIGPGIQVIADYDEPIFFSDGLYWRYDDGCWYRSAFYTGHWAYVEAPPIDIHSIARPSAYTHYRPRGYVRHARPLPQRRDEHYIVRSPPARIHHRRAPHARPYSYSYSYS